MGSLDSSVIARLGLNGGVFEILLDPAVMDVTGRIEESDLLSYLIVESVFKDANKGIRPAESEIVGTFGTTDIAKIVSRIVSDGKIQLTAEQRKEMLKARRNGVVVQVAATVINPETGLPHPVKRIELALKESKFRVDLFKPMDELVKDAVRAIGGLIPIELKIARSARADDCRSCCGNCLTLKSQERRRRRR